MLGIVVAVTCKHGKERGSNDVWFIVQDLLNLLFT